MIAWLEPNYMSFDSSLVSFQMAIWNSLFRSFTIVGLVSEFQTDFSLSSLSIVQGKSNSMQHMIEFAMSKIWLFDQKFTVSCFWRYDHWTLSNVLHKTLNLNPTPSEIVYAVSPSIIVWCFTPQRSKYWAEGVRSWHSSHIK